MYEIGSFQVEGQEGYANLQGMFPDKVHVGCDMRPGPGVDWVEDVSAINLPDGSAGTVLCIETFEHVFEVRKAFDEAAKGASQVPWCQKVGGPFRALSGARKCLLTRSGHESGVRDSRGRPAVLVGWLMRAWRGIVLKKSQLGEDRCNFKPRRTDHTE